MYQYVRTWVFGFKVSVSVYLCLYQYVPTWVFGFKLFRFLSQCIYRIAGNFRGSKLSRIRPKIIFTELIFANFIILPFLYRIIYNFHEFYFRESQNIAKIAKVIGLESFRLYGIMYQYVCTWVFGFKVFRLCTSMSVSGFLVLRFSGYVPVCTYLGFWF